MGRANNSSIDTSEGMKIAILGQQRKKREQENCTAKKGGLRESEINATKKEHLASLKAKARKKAKMAKAARKRNKR